MQNLEETLKQRGTVHGKYSENAERTMGMLSALGDKFTVLPPAAQFGILMILGKIARIVSGDPTFYDHWIDIEGYARITRDTFNKDTFNKKQ